MAVAKLLAFSLLSFALFEGENFIAGRTHAAGVRLEQALSAGPALAEDETSNPRAPLIAPAMPQPRVRFEISCHDFYRSARFQLRRQRSSGLYSQLFSRFAAAFLCETQNNATSTLFSPSYPSDCFWPIVDFNFFEHLDNSYSLDDSVLLPSLKWQFLLISKDLKKSLRRKVYDQMQYYPIRNS